MNTTQVPHRFLHKVSPMKTYPQHCIDCDDGLYEVLTVDYKCHGPDGMEVIVPGVEILRCATCGVELIPAASDRLISEAVARANEQLTPAELYAFMEAHDLKQKEVAEICGFGEKTFHRWLRGTQVVSRSMGYYLRVLQQFPEAFAFVRERGWRKESQPAESTSPSAGLAPVGDPGMAPDVIKFPALAKRQAPLDLPERNPAQLFAECHGLH